MAISEDTRAIVAANLTVAHCSVTGAARQPKEGETETQTQSAIFAIYQMYARSLGIGVALGSSQASKEKAPAN